jgi:hypothetical protein
MAGKRCYRSVMHLAHACVAAAVLLSIPACAKSSAPAAGCDAATSCERLKGHAFVVAQNCSGTACSSLSVGAAGSGAWMKGGQVRMGHLDCASTPVRFVAAGLEKPLELNAACSEFTWDGEAYVLKK